VKCNNRILSFELLLKKLNFSLRYKNISRCLSKEPQLWHFLLSLFDVPKGANFLKEELQIGHNTSFPLYILYALYALYLFITIRGNIDLINCFIEF
jgi:hypothetical protein